MEREKKGEGGGNLVFFPCGMDSRLWRQAVKQARGVVVLRAIAEGLCNELKAREKFLREEMGIEAFFLYRFEDVFEALNGSGGEDPAGTVEEGAARKRKRG